MSKFVFGERLKPRLNLQFDHNILELYNVTVQIRVTTTKRKRVISYSKVGIRVATQVAKQHKFYDLKKTGNIRKTSNLVGNIT